MVEFTDDECKAIYEWLDQLTGSSPENIFSWDGTDSWKDPHTSAAAKLFKAVNQDIPDSTKKISALKMTMKPKQGKEDKVMNRREPSVKPLSKSIEELLIATGDRLAPQMNLAADILSLVASEVNVWNNDHGHEIPECIRDVEFNLRCRSRNLLEQFKSDGSVRRSS